MATFRTVGAGGENRVEDVKFVQGQLNAWLARNGMPQIAVDGLVGPVTTGAIVAFQLAHGGTGDGVMQVLDEGQVPLAQGQADGRTIAEACQRARDDCRARANCAPGATLQMGKCTCWKGGTEGWTCIVQCSCSSLVA